MSITLKRKTAWGDHLRNYKVVLDNKEVGKIADGETFSYEVYPGQHSLYLKIDYARSKKIDFQTNSKKAIVFHCSPNITGFKILLKFLYSTVLSTRYIRLECAPEYDVTPPGDETT